MSLIVFAMLLAAHALDSADRTILTNDRPEFPVGLARDMKLLEQVNQVAIKDPLAVPALAEESAKRGDLLPIPSGTKARSIATDKLRGPMFKEIVQVEITEGDHKGVRGWVCDDALMTEKQFADFKKAGAGNAEHTGFKPLYRDPAAGEKAYLAPQSTMFGMVRSLIRLAAVNDSSWDVFQQWQGATESTRDAVLKRLEGKKAIFFTGVNTEVNVQKVFPEKMVNGIYPVQVEITSGQFRGRVGWAPVTVVSPVPGKRAKPASDQTDKSKAELQATIEHRKKRRQSAQARNDAQTAQLAAEQKEGKTQLQTQMQLQMLQQQAALAESRLAGQAALNDQLARTLRQRQLSDSYKNGGGVVYGPNGAMTMDEFLRSQNNNPNNDQNSP